jgi:FkbM family methyltransferase
MAKAEVLDLGTHEIVERRAVARYVRPGDLVLEGGAGIGSVTRVLLDAGASVVAFEPGPEPFPSLERLAAAYPDGRCEPVHAALTEHDGFVPLHVYHPWYATRTTSLGGCVPHETIRVSARSWGAELKSRPYQGLVIDIEGAEHALLTAEFPPSLRWIVAEIHGEPEQIARTLAAVPTSFRLDAIEAHFTYLVAGWVRA